MVKYLIIAMATTGNHTYPGCIMQENVAGKQNREVAVFQGTFSTYNIGIHSVPAKFGLNSEVAATERLGVAGVHCILNRDAENTMLELANF